MSDRTTKPDSAMGMSWGDKGCVRNLSKCDHADDDGCEWCCMKCNTDSHWCPECGTVSDHKNSPCNPCRP
jgi:hypothetical protein